MNNKQIVCVDLDGCVCNDAHRHKLAPLPGVPLSEWEAYHLACTDDEPMMGTIITVRALSKLYQIHIITGRHEVARPATTAWLAKYDVPYNELRMYQLADAQAKLKNWQYKVQYVEQLREKGLEPILFIEDWPLVAENIEKVDVPVLCINSRFPKLYERPADKAAMAKLDA